MSEGYEVADRSALAISLPAYTAPREQQRMPQRQHHFQQHLRRLLEQPKQTREHALIVGQVFLHSPPHLVPVLYVLQHSQQEALRQVITSKLSLHAALLPTTMALCKRCVLTLLGIVRSISPLFQTLTVC